MSDLGDVVDDGYGVKRKIIDWKCGCGTPIDGSHDHTTCGPAMAVFDDLPPMAAGDRVYYAGTAGLRAGTVAHVGYTSNPRVPRLTAPRQAFIHFDDRPKPRTKGRPRTKGKPDLVGTSIIPTSRISTDKAEAWEICVSLAMEDADEVRALIKCLMAELAGHLSAAETFKRNAALEREAACSEK